MQKKIKIRITANNFKGSKINYQVGCVYPFEQSQAYAYVDNNIGEFVDKLDKDDYDFEKTDAPVKRVFKNRKK